MSSAPPFSRRDFTKLAATGAGAVVLGCSSGIFSTEHELALTLSGSGRLFDGTGKVLATETLAPGTTSGLLGSPVIRPASISNGIGTLRIPTPNLIGFVQSPSRKPAVFKRLDRAADGSIVETTFESPGDGIPGRRSVRVPAYDVELIDVSDYRELGELSVLAQRKIEVRQHGQLVTDLTILASGDIRLATNPRFRPATLARVFLPAELHAQSDCGVELLLHFLSATLGVMAALGTCASGPWCILGLIGALIQWAEVIGQMEACRQT